MTAADDWFERAMFGNCDGDASLSQLRDEWRASRGIHDRGKPSFVPTASDVAIAECVRVSEVTLFRLDDIRVGAITQRIGTC